MRGLLPFLYCDLARRSIPVAFAQDAAGATGPEGLSPTGAFCLAVGRVPRTEIEAVLARREVRSKVIVPSSLMQLTPATLGELRSEGALGRTVLPLAWFSEGADWEQVLARGQSGTAVAAGAQSRCKARRRERSPLAGEQA